MLIKSKNSAWRNAAENECNKRNITLIDPDEVRGVVYGFDDRRDALLLKSEHGEIIIHKNDILSFAKDLIDMWQVFYNER